MRPVKLTISAFGPYASKQVIDFEDLNGRNIFVISGKTGAGICQGDPCADSRATLGGNCQRFCGALY